MAWAGKANFLVLSVALGVLSHDAAAQSKMCWPDGRCQDLSSDPEEAGPVTPQRKQASPKRAEPSKSRASNRADTKRTTERPRSAARKVAVPNVTSEPVAAIAYKLAIQVNQNEKGVMDLALNNAENAIEHYKGKAQNVRVEIVTYGLGLHMLRSDTSPVKDRIAQMARANPNIVFIACADITPDRARLRESQLS